MVFGANCNIQLILNGVKIERVYETKFLGVILDHKLSWKPHIESTKLKLSKSIGVIYRTSFFSFFKKKIKIGYVFYISIS